MAAREDDFENRIKEAKLGLSLLERLPGELGQPAPARSGGSVGSITVPAHGVPADQARPVGPLGLLRGQ